MVKTPNRGGCSSEPPSNGSMQRRALRAAADADRQDPLALPILYRFATRWLRRHTFTTR
jgi:hypothetical protein